MERHDAVVVGAGHAGLGMSRELAARGIEHVVLERGRIAETWRTQRWATFRLNTPAWMNRLPGDDEDATPGSRDAFRSAPEFADDLASYAGRHGLPVREGAPVVRVESAATGFVVRVGGPDGSEPIGARAVVVASGIQNVPRIPAFDAALPPGLTRLSALDYRDAASLPDGGVLVVGGGQTGAQLTEDLLDAGREVWLSPSRVPRGRRRYRGRDILEWLVRSGFYRAPVESITDPAVFGTRQPLISGVGPLGHSISLQWLASQGAHLVGRTHGVEGGALLLDDALGHLVAFADERAGEFRRLAADAVAQFEPDAPPVEHDPGDDDHPDPASLRSPERLDLARHGIRTVIWATGVRGDFGWLPDAALGGDGVPIQRGGATPVPGLFVVGLPWLTHRASGIIHGSAADGPRIADAVAASLGSPAAGPV
jgi:putative flavoprotein involved in K+ transport